jgi:hypothetical protein
VNHPAWDGFYHTLAGRQLIECHIKHQNVDPRFTQQTEQAAFGMCQDKLPDAIFRQISRLGNTGYLEECRIGRDMRIKPAGRRCDKIGRRRRRRILLFQRGDFVLHPID